MERQLTVKEVAAQLRTHPETVRRWLQSGRLQGYRPGGDKLGWRIPESEIARFIAASPGADATVEAGSE